MTVDELGLLRASAATAAGERTPVEVVVTDCLYACCGRAWVPRSGYEQTYRGWVDRLDERAGTFMLYAAGIGTITYMVTCRLADVQLVSV